MGGANLSLLLEEGVARDEGGEGVWEESWPPLWRGEDAAGGSPWERRCVYNTSQGSDDCPSELDLKQIGRCDGNGFCNDGE